MLRCRIANGKMFNLNKFYTAQKNLNVMNATTNVSRNIRYFCIGMVTARVGTVAIYE